MRFIFFFYLLLFGIVSYSQDLHKDKKYQAKRSEADLLHSHAYFERSSNAYSLLEKEYPSVMKDHLFLYNYGYACFETGKYQEGIRVFEILNKENDSQYPLTAYFLAKCYIGLGQGKEKAKPLFESFISNNKDKTILPYVRLAQHEIVFLEQMKPVNEAIIPAFSPLLPQNNRNSSISPFYVNDSLIFYTMSEPTTVKHTVNLGNQKIKITENYAYDMYSAILSDEEVYNKEVLDIKNLPKKDNFTTGSLSRDKKRLFFTRCKLNECLVYYSDKINDNTWSTPVLIEGEINVAGTGSKFPFVAELNNGKEVLFFSSDRDKKDSGWDIYYAIADEKGKYNKVHKLGNDINTVLDETSPYFDTQSNTLYFSSNGHPGYGGKDIFSVQIRDFKAVSPVLNIGYQANSRFDDFHYRLHRSGVTGMLVSNRNGNHQLNQILQFKYRETFDFKRIEHEYSERKYWMIEDDESSWIYVKEEGVSLSGTAEEGVQYVYLVNANNELIDVAIAENRAFNFNKLPVSEKFKIVFEGDDATLSKLNIVIHEEGTKNSETISIPASQEKLRSFEYKKLSQNNKGTYSDFSTDDPGYTKIKGLFKKDTLQITTDYDPAYSFYLLNENGKYEAFSKKNSAGLQEIRTLTAPRKVLFKRKIAEDISIYILSSKGDTVSVFTLLSQPNLFAFQQDDYTATHPVSTSTISSGRSVFSSYLTEYSIGGKTLPNTRVILINTTKSTNKSLSSDKNGLFSFERLQAGDQFSLVFDEKSADIIDEIVFKNNKGEVVQTITRVENPRFFNYKKLSLDEEKEYKLLENNDEGTFKPKVENIGQLGVLIVEEKDKTSFQAIKNDVSLKGIAEKGTKVYLYNSKNDLISVVKADEKGEFSFRRLPVGEKFHLELDENDESKMKNISFYSESNQQEKTPQTKMFNYRKIDPNAPRTTTFFIEDGSSFDFKVKKEGVQTTATSKKEPVATHSKAVEANDLITHIFNYSQTSRNEDYHNDFINRYGNLKSSELSYRVQICSTSDIEGDLSYEKQRLSKLLQEDLKINNRALFVNKDFDLILDAEQIRKTIIEKTGRLYSPIIVVYQNGNRAYSLIPQK